MISDTSENVHATLDSQLMKYLAQKPPARRLKPEAYVVPKTKYRTWIQIRCSGKMAVTRRNSRFWWLYGIAHRSKALDAIYRLAASKHNFVSTNCMRHWARSLQLVGGCRRRVLVGRSVRLTCCSGRIRGVGGIDYQTFYLIRLSIILYCLPYVPSNLLNALIA